MHNQPRRTTSGSTTVHSDVGDTDMDTPMPTKRGQLPLLSLEGSLGGSGQRFPASASSASGTVVENGSPPSRERDSRELKEFWKQYMRMPSSGPGMLSSVSGGGSEGMITPSGGSGNGSKGANAPGYRRPRVASLPTVKTPVMERDRDHLNLGFANAMYQTQLVQPSTSTTLTSIPSNADVGDAPHETGMGMGMSMSIGDMEDLRSYEAAVMARKAPTTLNLKVRRPIKGRGRGRGATSGTRDDGSASASSGGGGGGDTTTLSDCSSSSSLANAFGAGRRVPSHSRDKTLVGVPLNSSVTVGRLPFAGGGGKKTLDPIKKEESSSPSLPSPVSSDFDEFEAEGGGLSDMGGIGVTSSLMSSRPSFKRLPSQTLGPDNPKRPFYGFEEDLEDRSVGGWGGGVVNGDDDKGLVMERKDVLVGVGVGVGVGIAERRRMRKRRMSEPSTSLTMGVVGSFDREEQNQDQTSSSRSAVQNVDEGAMI